MASQKTPWPIQRDLVAEPMEVHLAHFRGDMPGHNVVAPRVNGNWQIMYPRAPHLFRTPWGERRSSTACLYLVPPGFPYAMTMDRYTHYSAHFSNQEYRGYDQMPRWHRPVSDAEWRRVQFPPSKIGLTLRGRSWPVVHPIGDAPDLLYQFHALIDFYNRGERFAATATLHQLLLALGSSAQQDKSTLRLKPFSDHLAFHCHESRSLADIARACSLSRSQLHRLVKKHYGLPPKELILREKMSLACQILERESSVAAVAAAIGFDDVYYFSRLFKSRLGISPSGWSSKSTI